MKSSILQTLNARSVKRKAIVAVALTSMIGALLVSPAFADDGYDNGDRHDYHDQWGSRGENNHHGGRNEHDHHGDRRGHEYRRYGYAQPVYEPAPVYYEPHQSLGISLFFPLDFRR